MSPYGVSRDGMMAIGGKLAFLGIVSQTPGQVQEIDVTVPGSARPIHLRTRSCVGSIGVVEPASKILKLLNGDNAKR